MRRVVVLPQPDGPRSAKNSPWASSSDKIVDGDHRLVLLGDVLESDRELLVDPSVAARDLA